MRVEERASAERVLAARERFVPRGVSTTDLVVGHTARTERENAPLDRAEPASPRQFLQLIYRRKPFRLTRANPELAKRKIVHVCAVVIR